MNTLRMLASPRVWGLSLAWWPCLPWSSTLTLAPWSIPRRTSKTFPIALVNEDRSGEIAGENVNLGDRVVEKVTGPDSPVAGTVGWIQPDTRAEALDGIGNDEYYGAVVIPGNYTERISLRHRQPADDTHRRGGRGSGRRDERPACEAW
jgi:hypothetical protein